jgi:hypothetical protein
MATNKDERVAEAVRRFPVRYDKSCKDFKDKNKKKSARIEVAKEVGFTSGMNVNNSKRPSFNFTN